MLDHEGYLREKIKYLTKTVTLVASRHIKQGDEITVDYEDFEEEALGDGE